MSYFETNSCFQTSILGYCYLLATEQLPYEEQCFHNFCLIDFSESPDTMEAVKHFRLDVKHHNVRWMFKDSDTSLLETFKIFASQNALIEFMQCQYPYEKIMQVHHAISAILSNL